MKRSIYVVDDQPVLVELTALALGKMNPDWTVTGFTDPLTALAAIKEQAPDAVLSDQNMPGMHGTDLLEEVRGIAPRTLRLIMSGFVPMEKLALITSVHQYIGKPFDFGKLGALIQRTFAAQDSIVSQELQSIVTSLRSIPSLPHTHHSLLATLENSQSPIDAIARLVGADPGLSVKVLQLSNTSLFGRGNPVTDVVEAVNCLGTDIITSIILSQGVFRQYESVKHSEMDLRRVWNHCWETACVAKWLCRERNLPRQASEEAFLAGLLHEVGRFILMDNFPDQFQDACNAAHQSSAPLAAPLHEAFKTSPTQLSAYVLKLWGLPPAAVNSISFMDSPEKDPTADFSMTSILYIAEHLASRTIPADSFPVEDWKNDYLESVGCADDLPVWEKRSRNSEISTCA